MVITFLDVFVIALATNQIVEIWRHSELFREDRFKVQLWKEELNAKPSRGLDPIWLCICHLLLCNWCLSLWVAALVSILWMGQQTGDHPVVRLAMIIVLILAGSRAANLLNDILYEYLRTPRYDDETKPVDADTEVDEGETPGPESETNEPKPEPEPFIPNGRNYGPDTLCGLPDSANVNRNEHVEEKESSVREEPAG